MRVLVDANILLDVLCARQPHLENSSLVWKLCESGQIDGSISALTFANLVYVLRRELSPEGIKDVLSRFTLIFSIAALEEDDLVRAADYKWKDFEDAVQYATAERIGADCIVSRNVKDFAGDAKIAVLTPAELLENMASSEF